MSRPSLAARPTRDVAGVVADMLGTGNPTPAAPHSEPAPVSGKKKAEPRKTVIPLAVEVEIPQREKTSFALRPDVKRHLTELKLDLRSAGHRVTEAEIVETLIARADAATLMGLLRSGRK
jgi:Asp-tRNA(Asn)/Glu-tRNA(Gln) amidotransferase A subunit family amidase